MRQQLVYDLPTRFFHWLFVSLFLTAFVIAKTVDDESVVYSYHKMAGLTLGFLVVLRIIWGFVGTQHARFSGFALRPVELVEYLKGIVTGNKKRWAGHNPASSWAAIVMMAMALGLATTGYLMTSGPNKETFEDIHEILANGILITAIMHITGLSLHTMRHKDMIGLSMMDGKKDGISNQEVIASTKPVFSILLVSFVIGFAVLLAKNFNPQTRSLQLFGTTLQLGENKSESESLQQDSKSTKGEGKEDREVKEND